LCEKFLQFGDCPFGVNCNYAHGVRELQKAAAAASTASSASVDNASNPNFKTVLCKSYMSGSYCQFGDKCQYAHGRHELREKVR